MVPEITGSISGSGGPPYVPLTGRPGLPIGQPISPIYYDGDPLSPTQIWQYFEAGMVVSSPNTCASTLYGPIFALYGETGQFGGPLGWPSTDVTQLPDGTFYAAFYTPVGNIVLWLDSTGTIHYVSPVSSAFIIPFTRSNANPNGIDPSAAGIRAFAQQKLQAMANNALQSNQELSDNVSSITATVTSLATGSGGCQTPPGDDIGVGQYGTSLVRSHVFGVHFDFSLSGCAGAFGSASADIHVTIQLSVSLPSISGFLVGYQIDNVSSPLGQGDTQIWDGLDEALQGYYGTDLIGLSLQPPNEFTLLTVLVDFFGAIDVYIEPDCMTTKALNMAATPDQQDTLRRIRQLREQLAQTPDGKAVIQVTEVMSPVLSEGIQAEPDAQHLWLSIAEFLGNAFQDDSDVAVRFSELARPASQLHGLLTLLERQGGQEFPDHLVARAVRFIREEISGNASFAAVMRSLDDILVEETRRLGAKRSAT